MIVEDERIVALHLRQQLTRLGYGRITVYSSGESALAAIMVDTPDLILMDIHIDGDIDGIETAAGVPGYLHVPVIYLSAYSEDQTLERAKRTHPYGYLIKPFAERELHAAIQMALQRRKVELALKHSEERLYLAMKAANMSCWEIDLNTRKIETTGPTGILYPDGNSSGVAINLDTFLERVVPEDYSSVKNAFEDAIGNGNFFDVVFRAKDSKQSVFWYRAQGKTFERTTQNPRRIIGVVQDATEQQVASARLRQASTVYETSQDGILILDSNLRITSANRSYASITGISINAALGQRPHILARKTFPLSFYRDMFKSLESRKHWQREISTQNADGDPIILMVQVIAVIDDNNGDISHYVAIISDRTAIRRAEEELQYLAHYDGLTGLPNRMLASDRLERALERASARGTHLACMFIDIDNFKTINDTMGHNAGDQLLIVVARRLKSLVTSTDTIARLGGDEFLLTAEDIKDRHAAADLANRLLRGLRVPVTIADREISISASIGISLFSERANNAQDLVRQADTAMYAAKNSGRNGFTFYQSAMTEDATHFMTRNQQLQRGLENGELVLFYQPQYSRNTGKISGVEALIRWNHPTEGLLGPGEIIPVAEQSGLINEIGQWVVEEACAQAMRWRDEGHPALKIAVNVSVRQLRSDDFVAIVRHALEMTKISPRQLEIEITESTIQNDTRIISRLHELRRLGISLAIDDFGTGFSCLGSIKSLPIERIKIDQSFVRGIPNDQDNTALTEAITALAAKLGLAVTVEGIEEKPQLDFINNLECTDFQGFYFSRPIPAAQVFELPEIAFHTS
ncbi:diguanylate cyclase [Thalassospira profundimaris]|uniref:Diguanylate cyclase n=2 Tax=Thalassospira profundimaris TaxID=502049 RepID=A0A367X3W3_9PROT|nr:diguanylate cyclase [Thalassospira profundimaris]